MKQFLLLFMSLLLAVAGIAQQLSYRFANPEIIRLTATDRLEFDVQIKADNNTTYLWSSQVVLRFNNSAFGITAIATTTIPIGITAEQSVELNGPKYQIIKNINDLGDVKVISLGIIPSEGPTILPEGPDNDWSSLITTNWQTLLRVRIRMEAGGSELMAGISFVENNMNGLQEYFAGPNQRQFYLNPNLYEGNSLEQVYLGRIFSDAHGWSQAGELQIDWTTAANTTIWDGNATITHTDNTAALANNLTINSGQSLTVNAGKALTVNGALNNNGTLTVKSDVTGTGSLIHNTAGVPATVERYFATAEKWRLVSSPVVQQAIAGDWTPAGSYAEGHGYDFYAYSEATATWLNQKVAANSIDNFITGKGYLVLYQTAPLTPKFIDDLNNGNVVNAVTKTGTGNHVGANLIGNPYASGIDWNLADRSLFEDNYAYVYDATANAGSGAYVPVNGSVADAFIAPHQGFFVLKKDAGSSDFTFTNAMRAHGGTFTKQQQMQEALVLRLSDDTYYDQTTLRIHDNSGFERDRQDARKFFSYNQQTPQLYSFTTDHIQVSINSIPAINEEVAAQLGMRIPADGMFSIDIAEVDGAFGDQTLYLEDTKLDVLHNLLNDGQYSFAAEAGTLNNRFLIHFGAFSLGENSGQTAVRAYMNDNTLYILNAKGQTQIWLYDLQGRLLQSQSFKAEGLHSMPIALPAGLFVVRILDAEGVSSTKIIVK